MRNSHSLLKALDFNSFAERNMLFFSNIKKNSQNPRPLPASSPKFHIPPH